MISKLFRLFIAAVALVTCCTALVAVEPSEEESAIPLRLLAAVEKSDYEAYVAKGDAKFKSLPKERFEGAVTHLAPKLRSGYEITCLGDLRKKGMRITLWKISYKDGSDDGLATLSIKDGEITGFVVN
jgi:hypothetical protein